MAKQNSVALTARDFEILTALDRTPLTPRQLQTTSQSFDQPFSDEALARRRLGKLRDAGFVQSFPYSLVSEGRAPKYWKLTRAGYRLIYGADAIMPSRRYFSEVPMGNHFHTHSIAAVIAHIVACGKRHGVEMDQFARENSFKLQAGQFQLYPDAAFRLVRKSQRDRPYSFVLELDNGTERVRSNRDTESLERKIRGYDAHQSQYKRDDPARYLVLFVTTRSKSRLDHVLAACGSLVRNPNRTTVIGTTLQTLLDCDPFASPNQESNQGLKRTLIPVC
ncbi:replication-relaxation family protein [Rhodopirellula sallentina]|uniref:Replication-relaxation n=1 Tax=Rhodopirellula sallentina SM41 TaxID=1263870 RepID=M5U1B4_9BACT|nr:replication-relaxation family protein [Rhodopirellula sallentina]EMI55074.1 hypothetical protein RSSM_03398 [Rhodopirellula sallentina SM41]